MREFTTGDLVRKVGDVTHAASLGPVTITHHRKPRYVLMSVEAFEGLTRPPFAPPTRQAYRSDQTPPDIAEWLLPELDRLVKGEGNYDE